MARGVSPSWLLTVLAALPRINEAAAGGLQWFEDGPTPADGSMSTDDALAVVLPHAPTPLALFLREQFLARPGLRGADFLQTDSRRQARNLNWTKLEELQTNFSNSQNPPASIENARKQLNKLVLEANRKIDIERVKCSTYKKENGRLMENTRADVATYGAQGAAARATILDAEATIRDLMEQLPLVEKELKLHEKKCAEDKSVMETQYTLMTKDLTGINKVLEMTQCAPAQLLLLQCQNRTAQMGGKTPSFMMFGHRGLRHHASKIHHPRLRHRMQEALQASVRRSGVGLLHGRSRPKISALQRHALVTIRHVKQAPTPPAPKINKCSIRKNADCDMIKDQFLQMQTNTADEVDGLREQLANLDQKCKVVALNYRGQAEAIQTHLASEQARLAEATKIVNEVQEQTRLKGIQQNELRKDWEAMKYKCHTNVGNLKKEMCGLRQIRKEVYKINGVAKQLQDCEVTPWNERECSVTCGGGLQKLVRNVVVPPDEGASCPPLEMEQSCAEVECPVDCQQSSWSEWSDCTAKCGGGVKQRMRKITQESEHGGKPCEGFSEAASCANDPCDAECVLGEWSAWSVCSKACGSGFSSRKREVTVPAKGSGDCPADDSPLRLSYQKCNTKKCKDNLKCKSKVDLILMLDGSGSVGPKGWQKIQQFGEKLVDSFEGGDDLAQIAVMLFSGPRSFRTYKKCITGTASDYKAQCNIEWANHFKTNTKFVKTRIKAMTWPKATTLTSQALGMAEQELQSGRADAASVVVMVTDGKPMSPRKTIDAARSLREKARLVVVPVGKRVPMKLMKSLASRPIADNVLSLGEFDMLGKAETISKMVADICPKTE